MVNEKLQKCKTKGCNNPVLDGKYCVNCKKSHKEKIDGIMKAAGAVLGLASLVLTVILKKPNEK